MLLKLCWRGCGNCFSSYICRFVFAASLIFYKWVRAYLTHHLTITAAYTVAASEIFSQGIAMAIIASQLADIGLGCFNTWDTRGSPACTICSGAF